MQSLHESIASAAQSVAYASKNLAELVAVYQGLQAIPGAIKCVEGYNALFHSINKEMPEYGYISLHLDGRLAPTEQRAQVLETIKVFGVRLLTKIKADGGSITLKGAFTGIPGIKYLIFFNYCPPTCKLVPTRVPVSEDRRKQLQEELDLGTIKMQLICDEPIDNSTQPMANLDQPNAVDNHLGDDIPF